MGNCINCDVNRLILLFEEYIISNEPKECKIFNEIYINHIKKATIPHRCNECGRLISKGEIFFDDDDYDDYKNEITFYFAQKTMDRISCCTECCEGQDIQEIRWSMQSIFNEEDEDADKLLESIDTASTVEDLLNEIFYRKEDAWDKFYESIISKIKCPQCGNGSGVDMDEKIDYGSFDRYTEVYTKRDLELFNHKFYGDTIEEIGHCVNELAKNLSFEQLVDLKNDYISNKLFCTKNNEFNKLVYVIKELYNNGVIYELYNGRIVYRTRLSNLPKKCSKDELWAPPIGNASHGRYNDIGTSIFYCANNINVVKKEVSLADNSIYNVGKFIIKSPRQLFPINYVFDGDYLGLIEEEVPISQQSNTFKQQYVMCNIVSAICANVGYDGIVYRSTKDKLSVDYALFCNFEKGKDIECIDVIYEK